MEPADREVLRVSLGKYRKVRIERSVAAGYVNGFVLGLSETLVLLFVFHDFHPEGCQVVRLKDITGVRSDEHERAFEKLLAAEGLLDAVGISSVPPLDDMATLLQHLADTDRPAIVEKESHDDEEEVFLIGFVDCVEEGDCWVHHFDAFGEWDEVPSSIPVDGVTCVQLEASYLETFLRHIPPRNP